LYRFGSLPVERNDNTGIKEVVYTVYNDKQVSPPSMSRCHSPQPISPISPIARSRYTISDRESGPLRVRDVFTVQRLMDDFKIITMPEKFCKHL
jgi:hypothetical protein